MKPDLRILVDAAERRGIPHLRLPGAAGLVQLGWGKRQKRLHASLTSNTSHIAVAIARDLFLARQVLMDAGVPVPRSEIVTTAEQAVAAARRLGGPVVVRPAQASPRVGASPRLASADEVRGAFERAHRERSPVIVEQGLEGAAYRLLVVDGRFVAAVRRAPPQVVGDGWRSVAQLVEAENRHRLRGERHGAPLARIALDDAAQEVLARQGLGPRSVPPAGMTVALRGRADPATGGTVEDATERTHPEVAAACARAARAIGLDVAGLDVVCRDISRPLEAQGGGIVEVHAAPALGMHEQPACGEGHRVGEAILDMLYPHGGDGRIPLVVVAGTRGNAITPLLIAHGMQSAGQVTGVAAIDGIRIGGRRVRHGDRTGCEAARTVLAAPEVEAAVLVTGPGAVVERGLGFDRCDVAVIMGARGAAADPDDPRAAQGIVRRLRAVAETASRALVLDACDPDCVALAPRLERRAQVIYFSMEDADHVVLEHLHRGGSAVYLRRDMVVMATGGHRVPLIEAGRLAFAMHGLARPDIAHALAAAAALRACGIERERIAAALASFRREDPVAADAGHAEEAAPAIPRPPGWRRTAVTHP